VAFYGVSALVLGAFLYTWMSLCGQGWGRTLTARRSLDGHALLAIVFEDVKTENECHWVGRGPILLGFNASPLLRVSLLLFRFF